MYFYRSKSPEWIRDKFRSMLVGDEESANLLPAPIIKAKKALILECINAAGEINDEGGRAEEIKPIANYQIAKSALAQLEQDDQTYLESLRRPGVHSKQKYKVLLAFWQKRSMADGDTFWAGPFRLHDIEDMFEPLMTEEAAHNERLSQFLSSKFHLLCMYERMTLLDIVRWSSRGYASGRVLPLPEEG